MLFTLALATTVAAYFIFTPSQEKGKGADRFVSIFSDVIYTCRLKSTGAGKRVVLSIDHGGKQFVISYPDDEGKKQELRKFFSVDGLGNCEFYTAFQSLPRKLEAIVFVDKFFEPFQLKFLLNEQNRSILVDDFSQLKLE
jgi:hypothetical protein